MLRQLSDALDLPFVLVGSIVLFNNVTGSQKPVTTSTGTSS